MLRRIVAALVVLGLLAHAQIYAAHQAMALAGSLGGGANWLCLSGEDTSPEALKALAELKRALGQPASGDASPRQPSPCPICFGLATAFVLPDIAQPAKPASFASRPLALPVFQASCDAARFLLPPGCGPPFSSV